MLETYRTVKFNLLTAQNTLTHSNIYQLSVSLLVSCQLNTFPAGSLLLQRCPLQSPSLLVGKETTKLAFLTLLLGPNDPWPHQVTLHLLTDIKRAQIV